MSGGPHLYDVLNSEGLYSTITVGTTPIELKVGSTALSKRQAITIQPDDNEIYWGYSNSVSTSNGTRIFKNQFIMLPIGEDIKVWLVANSSGKIVRIGELS